MNLTDLLPKLGEGLMVSLTMWAIAIIAGYFLGFILVLVQGSKSKTASTCVFLFVELGRGAPVLVVLYLVYFGLPHLGILLEPLPAAITAFTVSCGAYSSEIFRGAFSSIAKGQVAASQVLGFSWAQSLIYVLTPQALRIAAPALVSFAILVFQGTALAYAISVPELLGRAYNEASISFRYLEILSIAGLVYLAFSVTGTVISDRVERHLNRAYSTNHTYTKV